MPTVVDLTDPHLGTYTAVPRVGPGVCDVCHGAPGTGFARCYSCNMTTSRVSSPVELVVPISLYEANGQLHYVLRNYKDHQMPQTRETLRAQVAAMFGRFMLGHLDCITTAARSDWDFLTTVPSSHGRSGPHPLSAALQMLPWLSVPLREVLVPGPNQLSRLNPSSHGFSVTEDVRGASVLLVDDTLTSGTQLQSAASALRIAGAETVAAVVIGRIIRPGFSEEAQTLWENARSEPFDFATCCLH